MTKKGFQGKGSQQCIVPHYTPDLIDSVIISPSVWSYKCKDNLLKSTIHITMQVSQKKNLKVHLCPILWYLAACSCFNRLGWNESNAPSTHTVMQYCSMKPSSLRNHEKIGESVMWLTLGLCSFCSPFTAFENWWVKCLKLKIYFFKKSV